MLEKYEQNPMSDRRISPRYDFRVGLSIKPADEGIKIWESGISQNLSQDGISILHSKILIPGEQIYVTIPLFSYEKRITLTGSVAWVRVDDLYEDSRYWVHAGISFQELTQEEHKSIKALLAARKAQDILAPRKPTDRIDYVM